MTMRLVAVGLAACLWMSEAAAQSILQRSDWCGKNFVAYLPAPANSVPWLDRDRRYTLPKADFPIGQAVDVAGPSDFGLTEFNVQLTANSPSSVWRL